MLTLYGFVAVSLALFSVGQPNTIFSSLNAVSVNEENKLSPKIKKAAGYFSVNKLAIRDSHNACPNAQLNNIINQAIDLYPSNSQFLAQQIYSSLEVSNSPSDSDNWMVQVVAVTATSQWSYWGATNASNSQYFCQVVTDQWFISVVRVDVGQ